MRTAAWRNEVCERIRATIDTYQGERCFRPGAGVIANAIRADLEYLAFSGQDAIFDERHMRLIDKYCEPPPWQRVQEPREQREQQRRELGGIVRKAFDLQAPEVPAKLALVNR